MTKILFVEDDEMSGKTMVKAMTKLGGFEVVWTLDVDEMLRLVSAGEVDCVVMDVSLVGVQHEGHSVDGIDITRMLKALPGKPPIPVLLATAHALRGHAEDFLGRSGAEGYISKPILDFQRLIDEINGVMSREKGVTSV